jgi:hypothetical protein
MDQILHLSRIEPEIQIKDVRSLLAALWLRRKLFVLILTFALVPISLSIALWPFYYQTSGTVIVGNLDPLSGAHTAGIEKLGDPADLESQLLIAKSPRMLRLAVERPGVAEAVQEECQRSGGLLSFLRSTDCGELKAGSEDLLYFIAPRYSVREEGRSRVISIGYRSRQPEAAFILTNALILTYLEDQRTENGPAREAAAKWLLTAAKKINQSRGQGKNAPQDVFYKNLYNKAIDLETERRSLPNPSRLVSFAEMPTGTVFKLLPMLELGLVLATLLAGLVVVNRCLADRAIGLCDRLLPSRWALWLAS